MIGVWLDRSPSALIVLLNTMDYLAKCINDSNQIHCLDKRRALNLRDRVAMWRKNTKNRTFQNSLWFFL